MGCSSTVRLRARVGVLGNVCQWRRDSASTKKGAEGSPCCVC